MSTPAGTPSTSTGRLRLTHAYFLLLIVLTGTMGRPAASAPVAQGLEIAAISLVALACLGRIWCSAFVAGRKHTELVTDGPYALCRHPLYGLSLVGAMGLGIATRSVLLALLTLAVLGALLSRAARREEAELAALHGPAFETYARTTPRWIPRARRRRAGEPDTSTIPLKPRIFWRAFLDAWSFVLLYLVIDTARTLREAGVLPTLLALP